MRRTLILTAVGAATLSIGLGVGATLASAPPDQPNPTATTMMTMMMSDRMSADHLAACDAAHAGMTNGRPASAMAGPGAEHMAHHQGEQP